MAQRASARYTIEAQDKTRRGIESAKGRLKSLQAIMLKTTALSGSLAAGLALGALASSVRTLDDYNQKLKQTEALLKTTKSAAGLTLKEIEGLAQGLARTTLADEGQVIDAANQLLTFKSIAGDVFTETLHLAQDLSATGFGSLQSATVTLAKALEDPLAQLGSLSRIGVTLSDAQKDLAKELVNTGNKADAQRLILSALSGQIAGSGVAAAEGTLAGAVDTLEQNWRNLQRQLADGTAFNNAVGFVNFLGRQVDNLNRTLGFEGQLDRLDAQIERARNTNVADPTSRLVSEGQAFASQQIKQEAINRLLIQRAELENKVFAEGQRQLTNKNVVFELSVEQQAVQEEQAQAARAQEATEKAIKESKKAQLEIERKQLATREAANRAIAALADSEFESGQRFKDQLKTDNQRLQEEINELRALRNTPGISNDEIDVAIARRIEQMEVLGTKTDEVTKAQNDLEEAQKKVGISGKEVGDILSRAATDAATDFKNFGDVLDNVRNNIIALLTRKAITEPLQGAIGGLFDGIFSGLKPNAGGGTFEIAGGGNGERPVMVSGQPGETIEVSPRGRGNGSNVNITVVNNNGSQVEPSVSQGSNGTDITVMIEDVAARSALSGKVNKSIQQAFNVQRNLVSR